MSGFRRAVASDTFRQLVCLQGSRLICYAPYPYGGTSDSSDPAAKASEAAAQAAAVPAATEDRRAQLQAELRERNNTLRTYAEKVQPFVSQGWFTDITSDLNGTALHRLQVLCWTITLGLVFLISVYRELAMPDFNATLLGLMGISSAGYVGFKIPELNN